MGIGALRRHRDYGAADEDEEPAAAAEADEAPQAEPGPEEGASGELEVEQNGSWYTIYRDGEQVEKVQGQAALDEALDELEG